MVKSNWFRLGAAAAAALLLLLAYRAGEESCPAPVFPAPAPSSPGPGGGEEGNISFVTPGARTDPAPQPAEVRNPGCTNELPTPLVMTGESSAADFTRWTAPDLDGNEVTQEVLAGSRLTLVSIWSSYCGSCVRDLGALQEVYEAYDRGDVNVIGIVASGQAPDGSVSVEETAIVRQLQEMTGASFLQLMPSDDLISAKLGEVRTVPETFLLDSRGNPVGESHLGGRTAEEFKKIVEEGLRSLPQKEDTP